jgi:hypothetical protein
MLTWQHPLVKDADDTDTVILMPVKYDMASILHSHKPGTDIIAASSKARVICKLTETGLKFVEVTLALFLTPGSQGIFSNGFHVGFRLACKFELSHEAT